MLEFLNSLIEMGVAGFRIDSAKYINPTDLEYIYNNLNNLNPAFGFNDGDRPYIYQEVDDLGNFNLNTYIINSKLIVTLL